MRYDSESLEIYVVISRNVLLFKDIKISLGLLITARKMHAQFRENRCFAMSTTTKKDFLVNFQLSGNNSRFLLPKCRFLLCSCFPVAMGDRRLLCCP